LTQSSTGKLAGKRRVWSLVAVAILISLLVGACGGGSNTATNSAGSSPSAGTGGKSPSTGGDAAKEMPTFTLIMNDGVTKYPHEVDQAENPYLQELRRLSGYNVQFEIIPSSEYQDKMTVRFASKDLPDLLYLNNIDWPIKGAVENGVLMEIGPLLEEHAPNIMKAIPADIWTSPDLSKNGKIYATPRLPAVGTAGSGPVMYVRLDWLERLNMDIPVTLDDWLAYFEAVKNNDMNGNGKADEYGVMLYSNMDYSSPFFGAFGVFPTSWSLVDGKLIPDMIRPEMKEAIRFYRLLVEKGYAPPDWLTIPSANRDGMIYRGEVGSWRHDIVNYNGLWNPKNFLDPNAKIGITDGPTGPDGHRGLAPAGRGTGPVWAIPSTSKKAVDVVKFLNWAWSEEATRLFSLGVEGINYTVDADGKIRFDPEAPANSSNDGMIWNQAILGGLQGDMRLTPMVIEVSPNTDILMQGVEIAKRNSIPTADQYMPVLQSMIDKPDIIPGLGNGTLFYDMFAKVVLGQADLDTAFDEFVRTWRSRGGDQMIEEATQWYNEYVKQ
jgi:putative aldouronate transport system substrate-binding protein